MSASPASRLSELADLIHGVSRQLPAPSDLEPGVCTPVEITVMRYIVHHPGTSARKAAEATLLPSSNFSRIVRGLEAKGLVRREADPRDARGVLLHSTELAERNFERLQQVWSASLQGTIEDTALLDTLNEALRGIEAKLIARRQKQVS